VKGLKTDNVTITDGSGQLLWPQGDGAAGGAGATSKQAAEARYTSQLEGNIDAMLTRTLGPGKAQVQVNADLNMDTVTKDSLTYAKKGVPLKTTKDVEKLNGSGGSSGGTAGTAGNIPQYAAGAAGSGSGTSRYSHTTGSTDFGVDKTVAKIQQAPGQVNRLSIALMTDKSVANVAAVKAAVAAAAGMDPKRGDTITQATVVFPKQAAAAPASPIPSGFVAPAKWGVMGLAVLLFAFFTRRSLRRRESEPLAEPAWLREIDEPVRLSELESGPARRELSPLPARVGDEGMARLGQLVEREPDRVAAQVRQWMSED
jgi:flagellar M-ring protein FliF